MSGGAGVDAGALADVARGARVPGRAGGLVTEGRAEDLGAGVVDAIVPGTVGAALAGRGRATRLKHVAGRAGPDRLGPGRCLWPVGVAVVRLAGAEAGLSSQGQGKAGEQTTGENEGARHCLKRCRAKRLRGDGGVQRRNERSW